MSRIRKNKWIILVIVSLLVITALRLIWTQFLTTFDYVEKPVAKQGVLDLRGWQFTDRQTLGLMGEWEFYPAQFVMGSENAEKRQYLQLPEQWDQAFKASEQNTKSTFHYGTYRLLILLDENQNDTFGIRLNNTSAVYVNGQFVDQMGQPATSLSEHQAKNIPYTVTLTPENGQIDLVIHTSDHSGAGVMKKKVRFGTIEALQLRTSLSIGLQLLLCVFILIHGLYTLILYFLGSKNKGLVYFSLLMICALFSVLVVDDKLLYVLFTVNHDWMYKLFLIIYTGAVSFIPPLFSHMLPGYLPKKVMRGFAILSIIHVVFVIIAPIHVVTSSGLILVTIMFLSVIISASILWKAQRDKEDIIFLLLACLFVGANVVWAVINFQFNVDFIHYPFDLIFALLAFAAFWFKRFFRAVEATIQLTEQLQEEHKRKDEFLVNTSHELRNPLHGIINITQSMLEDTVHPLHPEHQKRLDLLVHVSKRLSLMVDDLLDVTRLKEDTVRLQWSTFQLQTVVSGVFDMAKLMLEGKPIELTMDIDDSFPPVYGDKNRLIQIVFNLVHNAVKYTDEGSIIIRAAVVNDVAQIQVEDTGIGIAKEALQSIFQPYEQAKLNADRASGGFGLGLSISKQLIELHGGTLTVQSTPGKGSVFTFTIPLADDSNSLEESSERPPIVTNLELETIPADQTKSFKVFFDAANSKPVLLVVDDDTINLNILSNMLAEHYEVIKASGAQQALEILKTEQVDLVVSDVMMPHVSGYELTRKIRERFSIVELPVLLLTARNRSQDIITGFHAGANDYVAKPVDAWELRARVQSLTNLKLSIEERLRMEGAWLQSQIQPHFIFNTLNSIASLGLDDFSKMQKLLEQFSHYLRLSFDFHNYDRVVHIHREIDLVQSYLYIEQQRFGDRLNVEWKVDANLDFHLPPLSIQPIVENAIIHGIMQRASGGTIRIHIKNIGEHYEVSIQNDGKTMTEEEINQIFSGYKQANKRASVALRNIDRRLKQLYSQGLSITSSPEQGTVVTFHIPDHNKPDSP